MNMPFPLQLAILAILYLFYGYCYGRLFSRAGAPAWQAYVPLLNIVTLLRIVQRPRWWIILLLGSHTIVVLSQQARSFVPLIALLVELGIGLHVMIDLAHRFGKGTFYGIILGVFSPIMVPVLAFGTSAYVKANVDGIVSTGQ